MESCPVLLRPRPVNRLVRATPGAVLAGFGLMTLLHGDGPTEVGGILAVLRVVLPYRGYWLAVETRSNSLTVWGMLRTRVIARAAISEVTDYPEVVCGLMRKRRSDGARCSHSSLPSGRCPALPSITPHA